MVHTQTKGTVSRSNRTKLCAIVADLASTRSASSQRGEGRKREFDYEAGEAVGE